MEEQNSTNVGRWAAHRGLSTATAAIVLIVVILVVGGLGYVGLNASNPSPVTRTSCAPANSPACVAAAAGHDVGLQVPFKAVQQGSTVPFTASLPNGEIGTSYTFTFGDSSTPVTQAAGTTTHVYSNPGTYIASVTALVKGATHDNWRSLVVITVTASYASGSSGNAPSVAGVITTNSSVVPGTPPTAIVQQGSTVTLQGTYTGAPTNPLYTLQAPTWTSSPGLTPTSPTTTNTSASAQFSFSTAGTYWVTFVGSAKPASGATAFQNYTWSVFVAPTGFNAGTSASAAATSPHPHQMNVYELAPGGSNTEDPAIDYETLGYEPIINVYQQLIAYNGSQTGPTFESFVPVLATCVPGSNVGANNCAALYNGNTLINGWNYTFVLDSHARFYDPGTGNSWPVYPTDVLFSVARTMAFSTSPCIGCNNGWILAQSLLSPGTGPLGSTSALHAGLNNTPQNIWNAVTINGTDCPAAAMTSSNGCVTFHANGSGINWPYFLELIADPLGGSIVPCGWFSATAQGAGIPYWTAGNVSGSGDHPCAAPGTSGYGVSWDTIPWTAWDNYETAGANPPFIGNVQWSMAGSGPYALQNIVPAVSYQLKANPAYVQNPLCTWAGCWPAPGKYSPKVSVTWETSQVPGEQAYASGAADFASIPSTDTSFLLQLIQQGKVAATSFPSISIFFFPFNLGFSMAGAKQYTSNPITIPTDFFSYVGLRQFMAHAYPYQTIQQTINTKDGIQFFFNYGGAIPQFMANYYPTNVSFPSTDPDPNAANAGGAAWWWAQATNPTSPFYDPELASCTPSSPCQFPMFGQTGAPDLDQRIALWAAQVSTLTNGAVKMNPIDINFIDLVINSLYTGPYLNPMPLYNLGWAPDYPDPTDYVAPLYRSYGTYTQNDVVAQQLYASFNDSSCTASHPVGDYTYWSGLAQTSGIPNNCQGAAYAALQSAMAAAAVMPAGPQRVLTYAEAEQIANGLALYVYWAQQNAVVSSSSWIDPTTYNSNVTIGGGADSTWFTIQGNGIT